MHKAKAGKNASPQTPFPRESGQFHVNLDTFRPSGMTKSQENGRIGPARRRDPDRSGVHQAQAQAQQDDAASTPANERYVTPIPPGWAACWPQDEQRRGSAKLLIQQDSAQAGR